MENSILYLDGIMPYHLFQIKYIAQSYDDSFNASGFSNAKTWLEQFYKLSNLEIINLGVSGYGPDQSIVKHEQYSQNKKFKIHR
tara:strand:- start:307 stop:558 length:252 start_codon:yes stop_codon:yes gene_type:complete